METEMKVKQIIDRFFEDPEFREEVLSDKIQDQENALGPYFIDDEDGLKEAIGALNRILNSPSRDAIVEFSRWTDHTIEFAP